MKILKRILLLLSIILTVVVFINYPKLNMLSGYAAKNTASSVFVAERNLDFTNNTDNNFSPVNLATNTVNSDEKTATSSAFGLLTRNAIYREGLGAVLTLSDEDETATYLTPKRSVPDNKTPYPYGNAPQKDTIFKNVDYNLLNETLDILFDEKNKTRAAIVIYKDQIIAEKYAKGFTKESKILGWSMTKSITSTIFGILEHQNKINVQEKAPIEAWKDDDRSKITIHNLLQMNSGLAWDENYDKISDATKMLFLERDMTKTQVYKEFAGKPNESWNYSSGTTNLLSGILRNEFNTHQEYLDFWYTQLIDKIGMNSMLIETDLEGNYVGSSYAWATPRDWAKLGLLYLKNGNWLGEQIFTKKWVDYATTPTPSSNGWYGAQIWLNAGNRYPSAPSNMYFFSGYQGQNVFILPNENLVIVRMGLSKNADVDELLKGVINSIQN
ncbi:serine hydrolase domain-containing protein [Polaribacter dokdonensis]|uniref:Beta-lactamase n=1 Tax=Polaribacter dokdonensis DSW-5 TaxID=1300348 RepID=A0A0M9CG25_9FLAO|nr:serine hydrolase [Polaribacter dokdonensis]KOY51812.1 Beta-lactamase [Polaribacter dokdonensis DSW-5]SEE02393.1 CubicO group peptidase, beta-lactamase class C family [Polaribacter dokdonensis DSW-5]